MFGEGNEPVIDTDAVKIVDGTPVMETGEGSIAGDFYAFRGVFVGKPRNFNEEVSGNSWVCGAEDGESAVEPFGVDEVVVEGWADTEDGRGAGGEGAFRGTDGVMLGERFKTDASERLDVKIGIPMEWRVEPASFVEDGVAPGRGCELEVKKGSLVWTSVLEDGLMGVVRTYEALGESGRDEKGLAVFVVNVAVVVVIFERIGRVRPDRGGFFVLI